MALQAQMARSLVLDPTHEILEEDCDCQNAVWMGGPGLRKWVLRSVMLGS